MSSSSSSSSSTTSSSNHAATADQPAESGFVRPHHSDSYVTDTTGIPDSPEVRKRKLEEVKHVAPVDASIAAQRANFEEIAADFKEISHPHKRLHQLNDTAHHFFTTATLNDLLHDKPKRSLLTFTHNTRVSQALQALRHAGVLSAPVVLGASMEDGGDTDQFLGLFDALTLLRKIDTEIRNQHGNPSAAEYDAFLEMMVPSYANKMLITVCADDDVDFIARGLEGQTISDVVTHAFFRNPKHPIHRVAVFGADGKVRSIISQSDIVRFVVKHMDRLGSLKDEKIETLGWASGRAVSTIDSQARTSEAFRQMIAERVSCLGVADSTTNKLIANISASDLRHVEINDFSTRLTLPVIKFVDQPPRVITCARSDTVAHVLNQLVSHSVHRVYVVDHHHHPIGIVTLTDVLNLIMRI